MLSRFPYSGRRRAEWLIYNLFMRKGSRAMTSYKAAERTAEPATVPVPPILPTKREWRRAVLEASDDPGLDPS
jgi:hypothetical protein